MANYYVSIGGSGGGAEDVTISSEAITIDAVTTAPTKATSPEVDLVKWFIINNVLHATYNYRQSSGTGGSAGSGHYLFSLPDGLEVSSSWATPDATRPRVTIGSGFISNNDDALNSASNIARCILHSTTEFKICRHVSSQTAIMSNSLFGMNIALNFSVNIIVPLA
ncbi:MAG: hypothetical protein CL529_12660 [Aequorivita sp.]|nr:hypothetical protein [Aequorivita sp.]|tara:strand:+ start:23485 stop:23982 length:498 start_codon:yes stop_codon:yes gene_type:complete